MYEKRAYITKVVKITRVMPWGIEDTQVPYLASLSVDPTSQDDPFHWNVIYDDLGDIDGIHPGIHERCIVSVYTTLENHAILEADKDITRIDDL